MPLYRTNLDAHITCWHDVSQQMCKLIHNEGYKVRDIYLVGSQVTKYKAGSDYDSVILLNENIPQKRLKELHDKLFSFTRTTVEWYHFKVFSPKSLSDSCKYDGYRIASFMNSNLSLLSSKSFEVLDPVIDRVNFANSILIQCVYGYFSDEYLTQGLSYIEERITKWVRVNNCILEEATNFKPMNFEELLATCNHLKYFYTEISAPSLLTEPKVKDFLKQYFSQIPHEWVNKSSNYTNFLKLKALAREAK